MSVQTYPVLTARLLGANHIGIYFVRDGDAWSAKTDVCCPSLPHVFQANPVCIQEPTLWRALDVLNKVLLSAGAVGLDESYRRLRLDKGVFGP